MTGVRNGPLARGITSGTDSQVLGVVPAGFTWLLKSVHVLNLDVLEHQVVLQLHNANDTIGAEIARLDVPAAAGATWDGWTTLSSGDKFLVSTPQAGLHVWANGAELPGTIVP